MNQLSEQKRTQRCSRGGSWTMGVFWDLDTCRHSPSLNLFILGPRLTAPDRHEEKLAHHAGGIAEQREKVRKLLAL